VCGAVLLPGAAAAAPAVPTATASAALPMTAARRADLFIW
jgi:hypothetical protein